MKTIPALCVVSVLTLTGCGDKSSKSDPSGGDLSTAPVGYLQTITKAEQKAVKTVDISSLTKAIEMFNVQEERFPTTLSELVEKKYIPRIPEVPAGTKLVYDPGTGIVKIVTQ